MFGEARDDREPESYSVNLSAPASFSLDEQDAEITAASVHLLQQRTGDVQADETADALHYRGFSSQITPHPTFMYWDFIFALIPKGLVEQRFNSLK